MLQWLAVVGSGWQWFGCDLEEREGRKGWERREGGGEEKKRNVGQHGGEKKNKKIIKLCGRSNKHNNDKIDRRPHSLVAALVLFNVHTALGTWLGVGHDPCDIFTFCTIF